MVKKKICFVAKSKHKICGEFGEVGDMGVMGEEKVAVAVPHNPHFPHSLYSGTVFIPAKQFSLP